MSGTIVKFASFVGSDFWGQGPASTEKKIAVINESVLDSV